MTICQYLFNTIIMKVNYTQLPTSVFTERLSSIDDPPEGLFYMGQLPKTRQKAIAIVGSRKPTSYGKEVTQQLAYDLAKYGLTIISGLALGVDAIAHQAALDAGGTTVAVVVNQLPDISPRTNLGLAKQMIAAGGAIVSEYGPDTSAPFGKFSFLKRNRLVSGLADAVLITEAAARSGTLNTASHALAQGREVFIVPGNITSPLSMGCNNLLKQGASPVTEVRDIIEIIAPELLQANQQTRLIIGDNPAEDTIIKLIMGGTRDGEELQAKSGLTAAEFSIALTMLEVNGLIRPLGANNWTIR